MRFCPNEIRWACHTDQFCVLSIPLHHRFILFLRHLPVSIAVYPRWEITLFDSGVVQGSIGTRLDVISCNSCRIYYFLTIQLFVSEKATKSSHLKAPHSMLQIFCSLLGGVDFQCTPEDMRSLVLLRSSSYYRCLSSTALLLWLLSLCHLRDCKRHVLPSTARRIDADSDQILNMMDDNPFPLPWPKQKDFRSVGFLTHSCKWDNRHTGNQQSRNLWQLVG